MDIVEVYGIMRSSRRGATVHARKTKIPKYVFVRTDETTEEHIYGRKSGSESPDGN